MDDSDAGKGGLAPSSLENSARPRTATDYVSDSLRRSILNGELKGGTKLSLADLASTYQVSTTPVREALRELSHEGLVNIDTYRGGTVALVSRDDVEEIVRIRQVLEPMAIRESIGSMNARILEEAGAILEQMEASGTWDGWVQGNLAFHRKLYECARSRRLVSLIESLQDTTVVFMSGTVGSSPNLKETAVADHWAMIEAARQGDADRMIEITLRHLAIPLDGHIDV